MGVRSCVTAKLPVLRPWFWNLILLNIAAASCYFIASLGGRVRCKHPFIGRCKMWNCRCPTPAGCICSNSGAICLAGQWNRGTKFRYGDILRIVAKMLASPVPLLTMLVCKGGSKAYKDFSCYARPQHCQAGVQREPGRSPRNLQRKKESARRRNLKPEQNQKKKLDEKDGQGTWSSRDYS